MIGCVTQIFYFPKKKHFDETGESPCSHFNSMVSDWQAVDGTSHSDDD